MFRGGIPDGKEHSQPDEQGAEAPEQPSTSSRCATFIASLPPLAQANHFVNLTNGLEAVETIEGLGISNWAFLRIQSTACEQQNFELLITELDSNLLMNLALGRCCLVWDLGSRNPQSGGVPRALWMGLEFVRYALEYVWFERTAKRGAVAYARGRNVAKAWEDQIRSFKQSTIKRLKYYRKYIRTDMQAVRLHGVYRFTVNDTGERQYYLHLAHALDGSASSTGGTAQAAGAMDGGSADQQVQQMAAAAAAAAAAANAGAAVRAATRGGRMIGVGPGSSGDGGGDAEEVLRSVGYGVFYRGLSPVEWHKHLAVEKEVYASAELHAGQDESQFDDGDDAAGSQVQVASA